MKKIFSLFLCLLFFLPAVTCFAKPDLPPAPDPDAVAERALAEVGKPYAWGSVGPDSYDASGLVSYCLTGEHTRLGTTGTFLNWPKANNPQPGDICVSMEHCGIYIGAGQMVHAPGFGECVKVGPIQPNMIIVRYPDNNGEDPNDTRNIYLYLSGIEGESSAEGHENWIDILRFSHGSVSPSESGSNRDESEYFELKHLIDKTTPKLQDCYRNETTIAKGEVHYCREINGEEVVTYAMILEGIKVTNIQIEIEYLSDGDFRLVETANIKVDKVTWKVEDSPFNDVNLDPESPIGLTELQRIRILLDGYDKLAQNPSYKTKMDAVFGYNEWIANLRARLEELEKNLGKKGNADSTDSELSPVTGINGSNDVWPNVFACIGAIVVGLSVVCIKRKKSD